MTIDSWKDIPTKFVERGKLRILHLFLQAAHREGLLDAQSFEPEDGELVWRNQDFTLRAQGQEWASGSRLSVTSPARLDDGRGSENLELEAAIRIVGVFAGGYRPNSPWANLVEELTRAAEIQAAAYLAASQRRSPQSKADFESWTPEGHNLHPGAKTREGFNNADLLAYAPDFSEQIALPWIAVDKSLLRSAGVVPSAFELNATEWAVPVHPWQRDRVLRNVYAHEYELGMIRDLETPPVVARLSTSLRTVEPLDPSLPILKLSVGSLMTSTERSMSRHTVLQGPIYTEIFERLQQSQPVWARDVRFMAETGGLCWADESEQGPKSRQLSLLFRQPLSEPEGTVAVPCSTLPQPGGPDLTSTYFEEFFGRGHGAIANFRRYCELLIPFHLALYSEWGIALEAHMQNCLVLWSSSGPEQLWVRDWGGLRVAPERLAERAPDLLARLSPDSVTLSKDAAARKKLIACLYTNHLTEVVVGVARAFSIEETTLWPIVREISARSLEPCSDSLSSQILDQPWPVKALLRMRLEQGGGDRYAELPNPMARCMAAIPTN